MRTFYDAKTPIEQTLYVTWYGLAEMRKDLVEIKADAEQMQREAGRM